MDPFATVGVASAAVEVYAGLLFAVAFFRRSADREYGVAALFSVAAAQHALSSTVSSQSFSLWATLNADRVAWVGLLAAMPLAVQFGLVYCGVQRRMARRVVTSIYTIAATLLGFVLVAALPGARLQDATAASAGSITTERAALVWVVGLAVDISVVAATGAALVFVSRAYLAGRRGALAVVLGATVFLAAAMNDVGVASGAFATGYLLDAGAAAFVIGIATTPSARYAAVTHELERRTQDLRTRTRELRRSYEELRAAQEELVKKEQLAVVGELAAVIAHEVRNPLAIIANAVAGLRRQSISREDRDVLLAILDEETSRLNRLVTDLLRYARPVNVQRSHIALGDLLERALALANTGTKAIAMDLKMDAHEGRLWGDANLLRQVFDNLIDNAVQAMSAGGALIIRVRAATQEGADGLAVDIIDTGEGMDTQVRTRALDPFFTTRPSGTGLGLAIVDRIVDAHGGHLGIDSRAGEGTTVTVFLPHGSPSEPPPRPRTLKSSPESNRSGDLG